MQYRRIGPAISRTAQNTWLHHRNAIIDIAVLGVAAILATILAVWLDLFDWLYEFSRAHEDWELDELFSVLIIMGAALTVYSVRRFVDLQHQVERRVAAEAKVQRLELFDTQTGLPNRQYLFQEFALQKKQPVPSDRKLAVYVVDLYQFRSVNDAHGHAVGDEAIRLVAERLSALAEANGFVARLDGDKFVILAALSVQSGKLQRFARSIVRDVSEPMKIEGSTVKVGALVGVALYPEDGDNLDVLLQSADLAMSYAASQGTSTVGFFEREIDDKMRERIELERELSVAIQNGEVVPYYQPLIDLATGATVGYEVLARWIHPRRGVVTPDVFIPIAEDTNQLSNMTTALMRRACRDAKDWPGDPMIAVNIAPSQLLDQWLSREVLKVLAETRFPAHRLEIEITEYALVQNIASVRAELQSLKNLGVQIALDDFGTGYSGLKHLRELPFDKIKIDRSFIQDMLSAPESARIVEAILGLSTSLGLSTCGEGIETKEIGEKLAELGCQIGQGYYYRKPGPIEDLAREIGIAIAADKKTA